jgi:hypothetical protein
MFTFTQQLPVLLGLPYGLFVAALVLVFVAVLYRFTTYCFVATEWEG